MRKNKRVPVEKITSQNVRNEIRKIFYCKRRTRPAKREILPTATAVQEKFISSMTLGCQAMKKSKKYRLRLRLEMMMPHQWAHSRLKISILLELRVLPICLLIILWKRNTLEDIMTEIIDLKVGKKTITFSMSSVQEASLALLTVIIQELKRKRKSKFPKSIEAFWKIWKTIDAKWLISVELNWEMVISKPFASTFRSQAN